MNLLIQFGFLFLLFWGFNIGCIAQSQTIKLWDDSIPYAKENSDYQEEIEYDDKGNAQRIRKVTQPTLTVFDKVSGVTPAIVICPGGGYQHLSINKEGYNVAEWLNQLGIKAFVLKYRLPSTESSDQPHLTPICDLEQAIKLVRQNAKEWNVDPKNVGVMGFSAGGHLAAQGSKFADFTALIYPVISMDSVITHRGSRNNLIGEFPDQNTIDLYSMEKQIELDLPPTFIVHAQDDTSVLILNSLNYYQALCLKNIPGEFHSYQIGGHGFGMGRNSIQHPWLQEFENWIKLYVFDTTK